MKTYELTYIISSNINQKGAQELSKEVEDFIKSKDGVILSSEKSLAQTFAYPIKRKSSGYFATLSFNLPENRINELRENLGKNQEILRHFIVIKKQVKPLKKIRTRKPIAAQPQFPADSPFLKNEDKRELEKVDLDTIDKKLDEILNE